MLDAVGPAELRFEMFAELSLKFRFHGPLWLHDKQRGILLQIHVLIE